MTMARQTHERYGDRTFIIDCDFCSEQFDTGEDDFHNAVALKKEEGWRTFKEGDEWMDKCPSCIENWKEKNQ